ncbi:MAG: ribosomal protein S18-alanine N-acetyltransferase [Lachnospiraceae bacterium]|nr:ribosomal protein S18-alanine N-acetyltransferase [Lachnospiraceae bacterium]
MTMRLMDMDDIPEVAAMEQVYSGNPWDETSLFTYFMRDDTILLIAEEEAPLEKEKVITGFMGLIMMPPEAEILEITVLPECRNKGVGRALMTEVFRRAEDDHGVNKVYLEVRTSNAPARHLYTKMGFVEMGLRKNYYTDPTEDAITMVRNPAGE